MIDSKILNENYDTETYNAIVRSFQTLKKAGVFELFIQHDQLAVITSFGLNPIDLATKITEVQQTTRIMMTMSEMAGELKERTNYES